MEHKRNKHQRLPMGRKNTKVTSVFCHHDFPLFCLSFSPSLCLCLMWTPASSVLSVVDATNKFTQTAKVQCRKGTAWPLSE